MSARLETFDRSDPPSASKLLDIIGGSWMSQAVYVAAELRIADLLAGAPKRVDELAKAAACHAPSLARLMRGLASLGICIEREDGCFDLTPMGSLLRSDTPNSLCSWATVWGKLQWPVWGNLLYSVRTGESARKLVLGTEGYEHLAHDADAAAVFNRAMTEITRLVASEVTRVYGFSGARQIVDVGGGYGELVAAILKAHPKARGVVVDMPHASEGAKQYARDAGVAERCEFVAGDFFESMPPGGDIYLLKSVLHNWNDEKSAVILRNCRRAMSQSAKLLLVERLALARMDVSCEAQAVARADLNMLVGPGGRERTEAEFRDLLDDAGFRLVRIFPGVLDFSVIESVAS
jgi:ubiquinone/menaquinone biosynthesis C-methylase UbiE